MENPPSQLNIDNHAFFHSRPATDAIGDEKLFQQTPGCRGGHLLKCNIGLSHYNLFMLELIHGVVVQLECFKPLTILLPIFPRLSSWQSM